MSLTPLKLTAVARPENQQTVVNVLRLAPGQRLYKHSQKLAAAAPPAAPASSRSSSAAAVAPALRNLSHPEAGAAIATGLASPHVFFSGTPQVQFISPREKAETVEEEAEAPTPHARKRRGSRRGRKRRGSRKLRR